jgi:hypothetical protein
LAGSGLGAVGSTAGSFSKSCWLIMVFILFSHEKMK